MISLIHMTIILYPGVYAAAGVMLEIPMSMCKREMVVGVFTLLREMMVVLYQDAQNLFFLDLELDPLESRNVTF